MKRIFSIFLLLLFLTGTAQAATKNEKLLARVIYAEARGESYKGMVAVGNVVMNRVRSKRFGKTISKVVYARNQFAVSRKYNKKTLRAAKAVLRGKKVLPKNVYYFKSRRSRARWSRRGYFKTIGSHMFYKSI